MSSCYYYEAQFSSRFHLATAEVIHHNGQDRRTYRVVTDRARCRVSMLGMILAYRTVSSFSRVVSERDDPVSNLLLVVVISINCYTFTLTCHRMNVPISKAPIFQYLAN